MSGVSQRYPSLVQLAARVTETMDGLREAVKRLSKGGVSRDADVLAALPREPARGLLDLLEALQGEINAEADGGRAAAGVRVDALGMRDRRVVAQAVDMVVVFEVTPWLAAGVGAGLAQREERSEAAGVLARLIQTRRWHGDPDHCENAGRVGERLVALLDAGARGGRSGDVAAVVAATHTADILAALLQAAYAPLDGPPHAYFVEREPARRVALRQAFTRVFDRSGSFLLLESLTALMSHRGAPRWFGSLCARFLARVVMRPGGARMATEFLVANDAELADDKLDRIARLLLAPPLGTPRDVYYAHVVPQIVQMASAAGDGMAGDASREQRLVSEAAATRPRAERMAQAAVYALRRLPAADRAAFRTHVAQPVLEPLLRCFRARPAPGNDEDTAAVARGLSLLAAGDAAGGVRRKPRPRIEVIGGDPDQPPPRAVVASGAELAAALDALRRLVLGGVAPAAVVGDLVAPAFAPLLHWLELESRGAGADARQADALRAVLAAALRHLPRAGAVATVLAALQATLGGDADDDSDWPVFARGSAGAAELVWRADEPAELRQRLVPVDALLDVLAADEVRPVLGDVFMALLREQEALRDLARADNGGGSAGVITADAPQRWWLVSQATLAMVDRFGAAVLPSHADVLAFALNAMQRWQQPPASANVGGGEELDDGDGDEMLVTSLMLLSQIMEASQQSAFAALASSSSASSAQPGEEAPSSLPQIEWGADSLRLLRGIYAQVKRIESAAAAGSADSGGGAVGKLAGEVKMQVALVLALHGQQLSAATAAEPGGSSESLRDSADVARFNAAVRDVRDDLIPVQAHGIIELRNMVLDRSSALTSCNERMDAVVGVFTDALRSSDSYLYLNAVRGLAALADAHGGRFMPRLASMYAGSNGMPLDERLRVGEALLQSVRRAGPMLAAYAHDVVPPLVSALEARQEPPPPPTNSEPLIGLDSALADESGDATVRMHSALAIVSAAAQAAPLALHPWMSRLAAALDGLLLRPDSLVAPVLRRAAVVFWVSLVRGYDGRRLDLADGGVLRSAWRTLRRVCDSDSDEITRLQALVALEEIDGMMKRLLISK
ncbi:hypothetical protein H4R26_000795 [Coemansia thaxteri]|uniref:RNA polymerase II assembly factor Rtp1 C-terminal domain-containing protein n=1 Tax=Coemansia thaxteri TaxID=2663907 RepID=A0A9W8BJL0_9FUNG|nr:hypothetical protein H4R26_000795 [Coemansia thaxteri]KAJ2485463.1 hypothetical protein EV174_001710 [Coemansia sp. RSA 2320]